MRSALRVIFAFAAVGGICLCGTGAQSAAVEGEWEFFEPNVKGAFVGPGGECFYVTGGKRRMQLLVAPSGMIAPGFQPLLLDRTGRVWCLELGANTIHGIKRSSLIALKPAKGAVFEVPGQGSIVSAYEDSAGRVWFGNSRGVQWFDGKKWASKDLADPTGLDLSRPMTPLVFAEDDKGRLFFTAPVWDDGTCGTRGIWSFDGKKWSAYTAQDVLLSNEVVVVCPTGGDVILVNTPGRLTTLNISQGKAKDEAARLVALLNDEQWKVREQATADLKKLGHAATLDLKRHMMQTKHPEVRSRIKMVLDALKSPPGKQQPLPGGRYTCDYIHVRPPKWRHRPAGRAQWIAWALNVVDTKTGKKFERATLLLTSDSTRVIENWPAKHNARLTTVLPDGDGGLWIGLADSGLFHWDGTKTTRISTAATRGYWIILGRDKRGRVILSSGLWVAAYAPPARQAGEAGARSPQD